MIYFFLSFFPPSGPGVQIHSRNSSLNPLYPWQQDVAKAAPQHAFHLADRTGHPTAEAGCGEAGHVRSPQLHRQGQGRMGTAGILYK